MIKNFTKKQLLSENKTVLKSWIRSILLEMTEPIDSDGKPHFSKRQKTRLEDRKTTDFPKGHEDFEQKVKDAIEFLKRKVTVTWEKEIKMSIWFRCPTVYTAVNDTGSLSAGNRLWIITKGNMLITLIFERPGKVPPGTVLSIRWEDLENYIKTNNRYTLTIEDYKILKGEDKEEEKESKEVEFRSLDNKRYGLDKETSMIYRKNNPAISYSAWDVVEDRLETNLFDQETKDKILGILIGD